MGTTEIGSLTWQAIFPDQATIKIERGDNTYLIQTITTEVTNFSEGGGAQTTDSIPHFGGAYLTVTKPQEDFEVSLDVDVKDTTWAQVMSDDVLAAGSTIGSAIRVRSGGTQDPYKVKLEWVSSNGSEGYKIIYYNAYGVTFEKNSPADDRLTGTITFKLSPSDANGSGQRYDIESSNLYAGIVGSIEGTGSYADWETAGDTLFGFGVGSML
jgi:hypothetical protein